MISSAHGPSLLSLSLQSVHAHTQLKDGGRLGVLDSQTNHCELVTLSGYTFYTVILYRYRVIETLPFERNLR